jgi:HAMP domain-containing protein
VAESSDMSAPVTRTELRSELGELRTELRTEIGELSTEFGELRSEFGALRSEFGALRSEFGALRSEFGAFRSEVDTKLDLWGGALLDRMTAMSAASEQRIISELARHANALQENLASQVSVVDEKYTDLPGRVARLETKVWKPRTSRTRAPRR